MRTDNAEAVLVAAFNSGRHYPGYRAPCGFHRDSARRWCARSASPDMRAAAAPRGNARSAAGSHEDACGTCMPRNSCRGRKLASASSWSSDRITSFGTAAQAVLALPWLFARFAAQTPWERRRIRARWGLRKRSRRYVTAWPAGDGLSVACLAASFHRRHGRRLFCVPCQMACRRPRERSEN